MSGAAITPNPEPTWRDRIPRLAQRQDSVRDQLADLVGIANRLGMYDAADWVLERMSQDGSEAQS